MWPLWSACSRYIDFRATGNTELSSLWRHTSRMCAWAVNTVGVRARARDGSVRFSHPLFHLSFIQTDRELGVLCFSRAYRQHVFCNVSDDPASSTKIAYGGVSMDIFSFFFVLNSFSDLTEFAYRIYYLLCNGFQRARCCCVPSYGFCVFTLDLNATARTSFVCTVFRI